MATPNDYIYENKLQWQPSFKDALDTKGHFGYRGELVITSGEFLSPEKQLPPKSILKQAIVVSNAVSALLFTAELVDFSDFEKVFSIYKQILSEESLVILFVSNLLSDAVFEYEGITVYAYALDESSVWNELVAHSDLDKKELKKMSATEKLDAIYDGIHKAKLFAPKKTYEEVCALKLS
jgi:hypothetical protein